MCDSAQQKYAVRFLHLQSVTVMVEKSLKRILLNDKLKLNMAQTVFTSVYLCKVRFWPLTWIRRRLQNIYTSHLEPESKSTKLIKSRHEFGCEHASLDHAFAISESCRSPFSKSKMGLWRIGEPKWRARSCSLSWVFAIDLFFWGGERGGSHQWAQI